MKILFIGKDSKRFANNSNKLIDKYFKIKLIPIYHIKKDGGYYEYRFSTLHSRVGALCRLSFHCFV